MPFQLLGTSGALPSAARDNTALVFYTADEAVLVDCPGSPYQKILKAGLSPATVSAVIVTHRHVDHLYGIPSLAHTLALAGRRVPLHLYAPAEALRLLRGLMDVFALEAKLPYPIAPHEIPLRDGHLLLEARGFAIRTAPVRHGAPCIALRVEFDDPPERGAVAYSSDTSPCPSLETLARGAEVLIHEATVLHGEAARAAADGHTTGLQAGEAAQRAGVKRLLLCHVSAHLHGRLDELCREARQGFRGPVEIPEELREYRVSS